MSNIFKIEIINPEKLFLLKENVSEVIIPAFEGEIGILKDHIPIISFLRPGIIKIFKESNLDSFYIEDGIIEFRDNSLTILTSFIFDLKERKEFQIDKYIVDTKKKLENDNINDQERYLLNYKIDVLKELTN
ncbi:MAG: ATP synthase F1 subunit epsilon [Pelagibacteraceae bacterium TMED246]|nr:MAG: ATP synthase F1 subunit epsilon [Pelagibacteraceae bacterium TMED246]|tara:strand:+ start:4645 stop:5040 length:396 start_codon:yes stop_codon:yes gene_type:complete